MHLASDVVQIDADPSCQRGPLPQGRVIEASSAACALHRTQRGTSLNRSLFEWSRYEKPSLDRALRSIAQVHGERQGSGAALPDRPAGQSLTCPTWRTNQGTAGRMPGRPVHGLRIGKLGVSLGGALSSPHGPSITRINHFYDRFYVRHTRHNILAVVSVRENGL